MAALREAKLVVFVVITASLSADGTVAVLEKARDDMYRIAVEATAPCIWRIAKDGSVAALT